MAGLGCSVITVGEIYAGMRPHEKERTEELLAQFDQYAITAEIARAAGTLKNEWAAKGFTFSLPDRHAHRGHRASIQVDVGD